MLTGSKPLRRARAIGKSGLAVLLLGLSASCPARSPVTPGMYAQRLYHYQVDVANDHPWYIIYVPDNYDPNVPTPLILYWHGQFQAGRDGTKPYRDGIGLALEEHPELYPCLVALPQLPYGTSLEKGHAIFNAVLDVMKQNYNVDTERIYVAGASTGSVRALRYVIDTPDIFAGLFAIAGSVDTHYAPMLLDIPIFFSHGDADTDASVEKTRALVKAIRDLGGTAEYVEIPGANHHIFYIVYSNPTYVDWLFSQRLNP